MAKPRIELCSYKDCVEAATYILELDGRRYALCRSHYRELLRRLEEKAAEYGKANLLDLDPKEVEGVVRSIRINRDSSSGRENAST